ncbi:hypothetical protein FDN03_02430 [Glutamicibacter sp. V16R2B1]|nr:hypothetical protein FDN03_02430 [Glutamicibacter sp. V16R2B1]
MIIFMSEMVDSALHERLEALESAVVELRKQNSELKQKMAVRRDAPYLPKYFTAGADCTIAIETTFYASQPHNPISIGSNCTIRRGAEWIGPITVGDRTIFNRDSYVRANVTIGSRVNVGAFVRFITDSHEIGGTYRRAGKGSFPPIKVGDGTWIGAGAIILGGVTIGEGAVIAAGTIVNRDVPSHTLVGGVPMRTIRELPSDV